MPMANPPLPYIKVYIKPKEWYSCTEMLVSAFYMNNPEKEPEG
jgi:hypothetical protein